MGLCSLVLIIYVLITGYSLNLHGISNLITDQDKHPEISAPTPAQFVCHSLWLPEVSWVERPYFGTEIKLIMKICSAISIIFCVNMINDVAACISRVHIFILLQYVQKYCHNIS